MTLESKGRRDFLKGAFAVATTAAIPSFAAEEKQQEQREQSRPVEKKESAEAVAAEAALLSSLNDADMQKIASGDLSSLFKKIDELFSPANIGTYLGGSALATVAIKALATIKGKRKAKEQLAEGRNPEDVAQDAEARARAVNFLSVMAPGITSYNMFAEKRDLARKAAVKTVSWIAERQKKGEMKTFGELKYEIEKRIRTLKRGV